MLSGCALPPDPHVFIPGDRVDILPDTHKNVCFKDSAASTVYVDVAGRQGTINLESGTPWKVTYYRIHIDIREHEIIPVQALRRGVLEVFLTRDQFVLLRIEKNGASCKTGIVYLRPLSRYNLGYVGSMECLWDALREQYTMTLEQRSARGIPFIATLCGQCPNQCCIRYCLSIIRHSQCCH